jgi:hypothetical protein
MAETLPHCATRPVCVKRHVLASGRGEWLLEQGRTLWSQLIRAEGGIGEPFLGRAIGAIVRGSSC